MGRPRSKARRLAAQAMYQFALSGAEAADIINQFKSYETWNNLDEELFTDLVKNTIDNIPELDAALQEAVDRDIAKIDPVELALLRLGSYELLNKIEVPYKVILNEYINLAKTFGSVKSHAYINASLDRIAKTARKAEAKQ